MDEIETTQDENLEPTEKSFSTELCEAVVATAATTAVMMTVAIAVPVAYGAIQTGIENFKTWRHDRKTKKLNEQTESE